jgi:hypothetical protein
MDSPAKKMKISNAKTHSWGKNALPESDFHRDNEIYSALLMKKTPVTLTAALCDKFLEKFQYMNSRSCEEAKKILTSENDFFTTKDRLNAYIKKGARVTSFSQWYNKQLKGAPSVWTPNGRFEPSILNTHDNLHDLWHCVGNWATEKNRGWTGSHGWERHGVRFLARMVWWLLNDQDDSTINWLIGTPLPSIDENQEVKPEKTAFDVLMHQKPTETSSKNKKKHEKTAKPEIKPLSRGMQLESYCGFNAALISYAKQRYGNNPGGMDPSRVHAWYYRNRKALPDQFRERNFGQKDDDLQLCHIVSKAFGGRDWPYNYFIAPASVNRHFTEYVSKEWMSYIGRDAAESAQTFARWATKKEMVVFGSFDPVTDYRLAR